ncbi:hypothetical protein [Streptomyces phaeochromogenes]|nr:hypothetical protein [Streptomyces phaeochromogenes]
MTDPLRDMLAARRAENGRLLRRVLGIPEPDDTDTPEPDDLPPAA